MPPPMTSRRFGTPSSSSAPVQSITRGSACGMKGKVTGSEPAAMIACSKETVTGALSPPFTTDLVRRREAAGAGDHRDLALLGEAGQPAGQALDHAVLPPAQLVDVDGGRGEGQAGMAHLVRLLDHLRGVQQGLGRDAADVQADAAERGPALHQHHLLAEIGGAEGRRVAAGAGAEHQHLRVVVALRRDGRLRRRRRGARGPIAPRGRGAIPRLALARRVRRAGPLLAGLQHQDEAALGDLVADLHPHLLHAAAGRTPARPWSPCRIRG